MRYDVDGNLITNIANKFRGYGIEKETNLIRSAINADGTPYNEGTGWKHGYRLNSSGVEKADDWATPQSVTGFIAVAKGDVLEVSGFSDSEGYAGHVFCYDGSFAVSSEITISGWESTKTIEIVDGSCAYIRISTVFGDSAVVERQDAASSGDTYKLAEMPGAIDQVYNKGVEDGKASVEINLQSKTVTPNAAGFKVESDSGYDGLSEVVVNGDANLVAGNIKKGTNIFGVDGTYEGTGGITPSGSINITENGTFDVTNFASAVVNVASSGGGSDVATGEVTFSNTTGTFSIDTGKTDATCFLLYADDAAFSSSIIFAVMILPFATMINRYSSSSQTIATYGSKGTTTTITGSISNGVATGNVSAVNSLSARTYKWIAW